MNDDRIVYVWVNYPNDPIRNRLYSAYHADMLKQEDPFQEEMPCWFIPALTYYEFMTYEEIQ